MQRWINKGLFWFLLTLFLGLLGGWCGAAAGVAQDYVQSHMWLHLAVSAGHKTARTASTYIETIMTPEQIAESQRLVREWTRSHK